MLNRLTLIASSIATLIVAATLIAQPGQAQTAAQGAKKDAASECLSRPGGVAPRGSHWFYRIERPRGRRCWYLGAEGTKVRQIFVTEDGTAFVDLSKEAVTNHRGGSLDELFAVYAIVNAITVNLPAIKAVQILIDGQEVDTLAGHVDLRHPLARNMRWVGQTGNQEATTGGEEAGKPIPPTPPVPPS